MERGDTWDERVRRGRGTPKEHGSALLLHGNDSDSHSLSQGIATVVPTEGHNHSGSQDVYHEWRSGQKKVACVCPDLPTLHLCPMQLQAVLVLHTLGGMRILFDDH